MKILLLGDIVGPSGTKVIIEKLPEIIEKKKIRFCCFKWRECSRSRCWYY